MKTILLTIGTAAVLMFAGQMLGAAAELVTYPMWTASGLRDGSKLTPGTIPGASNDGLMGMRGEIVGIVMIQPGKPTPSQGAGLATPAQQPTFYNSRTAVIGYSGGGVSFLAIRCGQT